WIESVALNARRRRTFRPFAVSERRMATRPPCPASDQVVRLIATEGGTVRIRILVAAVVLAVLAGATACGDGGGTAAGPAGPTTGPTTSATATSAQSGPSSTGTAAPGPTRCHTSELSASLTAGDPGAGQRYATLSLTNTSARTCTVFGYGGLQPLDGAKKQLQ